MRAMRLHRSDEAKPGWWATTLRLVSLVLALMLIGPGAGSAVERHPTAGAEAVMVAVSNAVTAPASDPDHGTVCHGHCGCHQAINLGDVAGMPPRLIGRAAYDRSDVVVASVTRDRLPRPPRV